MANLEFPIHHTCMFYECVIKLENIEEKTSKLHTESPQIKPLLFD